MTKRRQRPSWRAAGVFALLATAPLPARGDEPAALPPSPDQATEEPRRLTWKDGETVFETGDFKLVLSNRIQFRFTHTSPDGSVQLPGTLRPGEALGTFRIRRAKTQIEGWFWRKEFVYELQIGWAGADATGGSATFSGLEDAILTWDASKTGAFKVKLGQYKVPFGRQEMTSSEKLQFVERSILSGEFARGRDVGVSVEGLLAGDRVEYHAGVFNGNGRNRVVNDNGKYQYDLRLAVQPWRKVGYSEGDLDVKGKPALALAVQLERNDLHGATNATDLKTTVLGADLVFKLKGLSVYGEWFSRRRTPEQGASFGSDGYLVQAGYFVKPVSCEVAVRYAWWEPSDAVAGDDQKEAGVAFSYFVLEHRFKVQADLRRLEDGVRGTRDTELRVQTQFTF
jgi:hypothetical protein